MTPPVPDPCGEPSDVDRVFRDEWGKVVAALARSFGDLDLAEEAAQEAFAVAAATWPDSGVPPNPGGWITTTARRRAIDRLRRESARDGKQRQAQGGDPTAALDPFDEEAVEDDLLRLVFTCCHPSLAAETQVALTLRLVIGLPTAEIARALLVPEATLAQRLVRAKAKIRSANVPFRMPADAELPDRIAPVLMVVLLVFNGGYLATPADGSDRPDLAAEAVYLARLLLELMPDEPEVRGLLALLLLVSSRRAARTGETGALVPLAEQDRSRWDRHLIAEGQALVRSCLRQGRPGSHQISAAINAVHSEAATFETTDWAQILALYDQLMVIAPTPVAELNRAGALAELDGPDAALAVVDALDLADYYLWHATRADLLRRSGDPELAADAYREALARTANDAERRFLERRLAELPA